MKTKNILIIAIAMIMAFITADTQAETKLQSQSSVVSHMHPRKGKIARWKANKIKRQMVKRQLRKRALSPRHRRGITIVL
jgi:hypothetical protein